MELLLVDDHALFRQGLVFLLSELDQTINFHQAESSAQAISLCNDFDMDLVLLDLNLPGEVSLSSLNELKAVSAAPIVVLSSEEDATIIRRSIEQGASGFIPKSSTSEVLIAALKLILAGGIYLPPNVLNIATATLPEQPINETPKTTKADNPLRNLSGKQLEALNKAVQGKPNKVIAREMNLSEGTIKAHLSASYRALGVNNRTEAVFIAAELGLNVS